MANEKFRDIGKEEQDTRVCLAVLIASGLVPIDATQEDAENYYVNLSDCGECPAFMKCLLCKENE